jgi:uncharacterized repeat protein (TIGR03803 family)
LALVEGPDGSLYGTTRFGGIYNPGLGTVFKLDTAGRLTTLHVFDRDPSSAADPYAGLILAADGNLYGTVPRGGPPDRSKASGVVFRLRIGGSPSQ